MHSSQAGAVADLTAAVLAASPVAYTKRAQP